MRSPVCQCICLLVMNRCVHYNASIMVFWGIACLVDTMHGIHTTMGTEVRLKWSKSFIYVHTQYLIHSLNGRGIAVPLDMSVAHALPVLIVCRVQTHVTSECTEFA